jgi:hypothetical protein
MQILDSCYGSSDPEDLMQVRNIYKELKMKKAILAHISEKQQDIVGQIQQISKVLYLTRKSNVTQADVA